MQLHHSVSSPSSLLSSFYCKQALGKMMYAIAFCVAFLPALIQGSALRFFGPNQGFNNVNFNNAGAMARTDYDNGDHGLSNNHGQLLTAANNAHNKPYGGPQYAYNFLKNNGHSFGYGIDDPVKGAHAEHVQRGEGGVVSGSYVVREADGSPRLVKYVADQTGFRAIVSDRNGVTKHGFGEPNAVPNAFNLGSQSQQLRVPQISRRSGFAANDDNGQYNSNNYDNGQYNPSNDNGQYVSSNDNGQYVQNNYDNGQYNPNMDNAGQYNPNMDNAGQYVASNPNIATAPFPGVVGYGYQFSP